MSISSLSTTPTKRTLGGTSLIIKEALDDRESPPAPLEQKDFKDTLARLSAQHESSEEDNPESDTAYQELLKPIKAEVTITTPPMTREFAHFAQRFTSTPERPKTSPSKLALSVELRPQQDLLTQSQHRHRLELLAPLQSDLTSQTSRDDPKTVPMTFGQRAHIEPLADFTERYTDLLASDSEIELQVEQDPAGEQPDAERLFSREQAPAASIKNVTLPQVTSQEAAVITAPVPPRQEPAPSLPVTHSIRAEHTSGALTAEAVERTHIARRVELSMENSPRGQELELDIKDIFGQPLKLKIVFEDQRARATCFGSQFHDPDQLDHVLDSVRTALEASGFELGDFIMHHHRDRRPGHEHMPGQDVQHEESSEPPARKEILRIVGIVNRIA